MKKIFVSTPIYYPNEKLHIGHAYSTVLADVISRYKKLNEYNVYFVTGSDEHGKKIADKAKEMNQDNYEYVTKNVENFKKLWLLLNIDYDHFLRTTDEKHINFVKEKFNELEKNNFIYKGDYEGWYCKNDESFFTKNQLKNNKCPECKRDVEFLKEKTYFLKISMFKKFIYEKLINTNLLIPHHRNKELINNFVNDLQDLSITRKNNEWGIQIKNNYIIYVWFDALLNYISTLTYEKKKISVEDVWGLKSKCEIIQVIGKEITRFHAIYWPIILKMFNYKMPTILAHGWIITESGDKMSKSIGNVIDPIEIIKKYGSDSLRFYFINNISTNEDGKFSEELLIKNINGILVNKFSNLITRTNIMIQKYFNGIVPEKNNLIDNDLKINFDNYFKKYKNFMNDFNFSKASKEIINYLDEINLFIDKTEPWKKEGQPILNDILNIIISNIWNLTNLISPILVESTKIIEEWLSEKIVSFNNLNINFSNKKLKKIDYLFKRI